MMPKFDMDIGIVLIPGNGCIEVIGIVWCSDFMSIIGHPFIGTKVPKCGILIL